MSTENYTLKITNLGDYSEKIITITQEQKDFLDFLSSGLYLDTDCFSFETKSDTEIASIILKAMFK